MSLGALSPEAHRTLTIGMRRLGATSNTGEGGEDPAAYEPDENGELAESAIKQVASARFGVTARYLARAEQLEIKMAQGSKPGEGGQLPAKKATPLHRRAAPRAGRDDLHQPAAAPRHLLDRGPRPAHRRPAGDQPRGPDRGQARRLGRCRDDRGRGRQGPRGLRAHLPATPAGPAPARSRRSSTSGRRGSSAWPRSTRCSSGNGLRDRVVLRTDGGLQTGRDIVVAALLGAEEFGFGTAALVAIGCDMARQCHLDTCPDRHRHPARGPPGQVHRDARAGRGASSRPSPRTSAGSWRPSASAAWPMPWGAPTACAVAGGRGARPRRRRRAPAWRLPSARATEIPKAHGRIAEAPLASPLDDRLAAALAPMMAALLGRDGPAPVVLSAALTTGERTVGARISGDLERARDRAGRPALAAGGAGGQAVLVDLRAAGAAGQSLGAFAADGVRIAVTGIANDYVAKGLSGGTVVVRPPATSGFRPSARRSPGTPACTARPAGASTSSAGQGCASPSATPARRRSSRGSGPTAAST